MRRFVAIVALALLGCGAVHAQGNSSNGTNQGNGPAYGVNVSMPMAQAVRILREAHPFFCSHYGCSLGQLIQAYRDGLCTIELIATDPPSTNTYRVSFGGLGIIVITDGGA